MLAIYICNFFFSLIDKEKIKDEKIKKRRFSIGSYELHFFSFE